MLFTHTVAEKIKEVQVNIPFSFLNELCCPFLSVSFFAGFQEVTVNKAFFMYGSDQLWLLRGQHFLTRKVKMTVTQNRHGKSCFNN